MTSHGVSQHPNPDGPSTMPTPELAADQTARCRAIVKWVHNWRCQRRAVEGGLCKQHARFGARVPQTWEHWHNDLGVLCCKPHAPIRKIGGPS